MEKSLILFAVSVALLILCGCDDLINVAKPIIEGDDFETPFDMLTSDLDVSFTRGKEAFMRAFTVERGTGTNF